MGYVSVFPPAHNDTYVKATSDGGDNFRPWFSTDPAKSLTGAQDGNSWRCTWGVKTNQRFHVDLGAAKVIKRIYYENSHISGASTNQGVQNYTLWGSNDAGAFAELTYGTDTGWTQLATSQATLDQHAAADAPDPQYIRVTNTVAYRYYAFKFADNRGGSVLAVRHLELQEDGLPPLPAAQQISRTPVTLVTLTLGYCALTFGQAPCQATGRPCYNTFPTCKDRANFDATERAYRFCSAAAPLPFPGPRPYVLDVRYIPTEIREDFTVSGRVNVTLADEPDNDVGLDPYLAARYSSALATVDVSQVDVKAPYHEDVAWPPDASTPLGTYLHTGTFNGQPYYKLSSAQGDWFLTYRGGYWTLVWGGLAFPPHWRAQASGAGGKAGLYDSLYSQLDDGYPEGQIAFSCDGWNMVAAQSDVLPAGTVGRYVQSGIVDGQPRYDHESEDARLELSSSLNRWRIGPASGGAVLFQAAVGAPLTGHMYQSIAGTGATGCARVELGPASGGTENPGGRFWRKLIRRNRNYRGRLVEIKEGFLGDAEEDFTTRFVGRVENIEINGAEVVLRLTDLLRSLAEVEVPARIDCRLVTDVSPEQAQITLSDASELAETGYILIGEEIVGYASVDYETNVLSGLTRGAFGSTAAAHSEDDKVGWVRYYAADNPFDILQEMLTDDAGLSTDYINDTEFDYWKTFPLEVPFSAVVTEPTKLSELYFEVVDLLDAKSWIAEDWKVTIRKNLPNCPDRVYLTLTDEANILEGSAGVDLNEDSRHTRILVYWDKSTLGEVDKVSSYRRLNMAVDADAESEAGYGDTREKKFFCRWIRPGLATEEDLARYIRNFLARRLFRTRDAAPVMHCAVELKDAGIRTGDWVRVTTDELVTDDGADYTAKSFQVVRREDRGGEIALTLLQTHPRRLCFVAPNDTPEFGEATEAQREYGFLTRADGKMSDDDEGYHVF